MSLNTPKTQSRKRTVSAARSTQTESEMIDTEKVRSQRAEAPSPIGIVTEAAMAAPSALRKTKAALLRAMLVAPGGASLTRMMEATGWQSHTVRAALSGLRKAGLALERATIDGDTVYRIVPARPGDAQTGDPAKVPPDANRIGSGA